MSRLLALSKDSAEALELAAHHLRVLAAVEQSHMLGDEQGVETILAGVDPIEVKLCADTLRAIYEVWRLLPPQDRGGTDGASRSNASFEASSPGATTDSGPAERSSAPNNIVELHAWSKKVPCS